MAAAAARHQHTVLAARTAAGRTLGPAAAGRIAVDPAVAGRTDNSAAVAAAGRTAAAAAAGPDSRLGQGSLAGRTAVEESGRIAVRTAAEQAGRSQVGLAAYRRTAHRARGTGAFRLSGRWTGRLRR